MEAQKPIIPYCIHGTIITGLNIKINLHLSWSFTLTDDEDHSYKNICSAFPFVFLPVFKEGGRRMERKDDNKKVDKKKLKKKQT